MTYQGLDVLYSRQQIAERVAEMGAQITRDLNGEKLVMIGVLKGAAFFLVDLSRAIQADATFDFVAVSSYGNGQRSSGAVKVIKDLDQPIEGKNVLIVEDILDTGLTLAYLRKLFLQQHPKIPAHRHAARQALPPHRENRGRLRRFLHPQPFCHRLWDGLRRALPQPARYLHHGTRSKPLGCSSTHNTIVCTIVRLTRQLLHLFIWPRLRQGRILVSRKPRQSPQERCLLQARSFPR